MSNFVIRASCPGCSNVNFAEIYSRSFTDNPVKKYLHDFYDPQGGVDFDYLTGGNYTLCECNSCTHIFQKEILNDQGMKLLYEKWIDPEKVISLFEQTYPLDYYTGYLSVSFQIINFFKQKPASLRFFDFGMGWGNWLSAAKALGVSVYGSELSEERVKYAKKNGITVITWDEIQGSNFDYINTDQVFEHLPQPLETLKHLATGLRKGGVVRICVPDGNRNKAVLSKMDWDAAKGTTDSLNIVAPLEHINCYTTQSLVIMAKQAGLDWVDIPRYPKLVVEKGPLSISAKIKSFLQLPRDIARKVYKTIRPLDMSAMDTPQGTNLFFRKP